MLSEALVMLGVLLLALAVYQANQYVNTGPQVKTGLKYIEQQAGLLEQSGMSAAEIEEYKMSAKEAQSIYLQTTLIDLILGIVFLFIGVLYCPGEARFH